ncbi:MAG: phosphate--AMP phosphotransferase [Acidaminococcus sp.]|jgi:polyphosphate:AMP phosphotransferase|nr:phosphate--AMP phosphotransferase [Acidaminococcus sp.]MCI2115985.1 phosphate--AMP phosphotransferase [Acidaminococcus sp.]
MLDMIDTSKKLNKEEYAKKFDEQSARLGFLQRSIREAKIPVIILFEGFRGAYRSLLVSKVISALDPRSYRVFSASKTTEEQKKMPFFTQFWKELPAKGQIAIHHRAWYFLRNEHDVGDPDEASEWYHVPFTEINAFEQELVSGGYKIIKIFTQITKKQQEKNIAKAEDDTASRWEELTPGGVEGLDYESYRDVYEKMLVETNTMIAPWHIVSMEDRRAGICDVMDVLIAELEKALKFNLEEKKKDILSYAPDPTIPDILGRYCCYQEVDEKDYDEKLKKYHKRIAELQFELYKRGISTIVGFEGWDAGGKGGAIKRLVAPLDPLGYRVNPVSAPSDLEKQYHYLWRFWTKLPKPGELAVFDRTWYGRVLVERVERFTPVVDWKMAYKEINDMEAQWVKQGIIVQKFWMQIDKDEQYKRFQARENDPNKTWKITAEDWRNRDKWDAYVDAVNEMLYKTDTTIAPWTVVEANNKKYARLKVLDTMIKRMEDALKDKK